MVANPMVAQTNDDPRRLRSLLDRACELAREHAVPSVMLGLTGDQGDGSFPEFIVYLQSALRVEDAIFRMTRERAVIHLSDLDREQAQDVFQRLLSDFSDEFPSMTEPRFEVRYFDVKPGSENARVKDVLTEIFAPQRLH
ncbi:MAG: hypothetical protein VCC19_06060 [Myxococcota bacterium]